MVLKGTEIINTYYEFDEDTLDEYKKYISEIGEKPSRSSFLDFIFNQYYLDDFEIDRDSEGINFDNFEEWINQ